MSLKQFSLLNAIKCERYLTRPCATNCRGRKKIGDLQYLDKTTASGSSGHRGLGSNRCSEPLSWCHAVRMDARSTSLTPSWGLLSRGTRKQTSTLPALYPVTWTMEEKKKKDAGPLFTVNEKENEHRADLLLLPRSHSWDSLKLCPPNEMCLQLRTAGTRPQGSCCQSPASHVNEFLLSFEVTISPVQVWHYLQGHRSGAFPWSQ